VLDQLRDRVRFCHDMPRGEIEVLLSPERISAAPAVR
jgi:hypothetical protein